MRANRSAQRVADQSGISIIEVMASVTIFALVAAAASTSSISSVQANTASRTALIASALIQDKSEQFRSLDPDSHSDGPRACGADTSKTLSSRLYARAARTASVVSKSVWGRRSIGRR